MMTLVGAPPDHHLEYSKMRDMVSKFHLKDHVLQTGSSTNIKDEKRLNHEEYKNLIANKNQHLASSRESEEDELVLG